MVLSEWVDTRITVQIKRSILGVSETVEFRITIQIKSSILGMNEC